MAQTRLHDYYAVASTQDLNEHFDQAQKKCVVRGMDVSQNDDWQVVIGSGAWFRDGVVIMESTAVSPAINVSPANADNPRWDVIYGQYDYAPTSPPPVATYGYLQGTPGAEPTIPTVAANQVALAYIYVPAAASDLGDCTIRNVYTLRDQMSMLLGRQVEGNIWVRAGDPEAAGEWVKDGDLWLETGTDTLYVWDEPTGQWVAPTIPPHASTHHSGASDALDVGNLADVNSFLRDGTYLHLATKAAHDALQLDHSALSNVTANQHHPRNHAATHMPGETDAIAWGHGNGTNADMVDGQHAAEFAPLVHNHAGIAPSPHDNEHHNPNFALEDHTHPLGDLSGNLALGFIGATGMVGDSVPTGVFFEKYIPNLAISGTTLAITTLIVRVATAPSANITFTFRRNGGSLGSVTVPSGNSLGTVSITAQAISSGDILQIEAPSDVKGAKGLDAMFVIRRS